LLAALGRWPNGMVCSKCGKDGHYSPTCRNGDSNLTEREAHDIAAEDQLKKANRTIAELQSRILDQSNETDDLRGEVAKLTALVKEVAVGRPREGTVEDRLSGELETAKLESLSEWTGLFDPHALAHHAIHRREKVLDKIDSLVLRVELATKSQSHKSRFLFAKDTVA
jgi:hypothetical protein